MEIMVILAAIVAAILIGPAVAVGAVIDSRKIRSLAGLLRSRLESVSDELGRALWRAAELGRDLGAAQRRIASLEEASAFWREAYEEAERQEGRLEEALAEADATARWRLEELMLLQAQNDALRDEVASLRKQRRHLAGQRDALKLSARGLTADAEGAAADANAMRALFSAFLSERGETNKRLNAANSRVKALEAFINRAYGPVDECEIKDGNEVW